MAVSTLLIAGATATVVSQIKQARIAKAQGELDKDIAVREQRALERQAKSEREATRIEEGRISRKGKATFASALAQSGKTGGQLKNASMSALTDIVAQFSIDRNLTQRRGLIRSRELVQRGKIIAAGGKFSSAVGKQRRTAGFIGAAGTGLMAAASLSSTGGNTDKVLAAKHGIPFSP